VPLTFPTLREFRAAHAIRGRGPELDYGEPWLTGRFGPAYRAAGCAPASRAPTR
jgi:hypothetical protein